MIKSNHKDELAKAVAIAHACKIGEIGYDEAKNICEEHLIIVNNKIKEVAQKYGKRPYKVTFTSLLR